MQLIVNGELLSFHADLDGHFRDYGKQTAPRERLLSRNSSAFAKGNGNPVRPLRPVFDAVAVSASGDT